MILCQKLGIHIVVDETYALTSYSTDDMSNPTPFTSVLNMDKNGVIDLDLCHVVHAIGKVYFTWEDDLNFRIFRSSALNTPS
jgi:hypothetical protein